MKLCMVGGATSIHTQKRVKWFAKKGIDVHVISSSSENIDGVKVYKIGKKEGSIINFLRKISCLIKTLILFKKL